MGSSSNVNMAAELDKLKEEVRSSTEQERWLEQELSLAASEGARRVVAFSHIPPFINDADEPSGYFPLSR